MKQFSFLHCGDLHLGHLQFNEPQRVRDFAGRFQEVVRYALDQRVDFVLISGDFFHKRSINAQTLGQAIELLTPLKDANIPTVVIEGNHDKAFYLDKNSWLWFLNQQEYVYLLTPQYEEGKIILTPWDPAVRQGSWLDVGEARIYGLGYLGITTSARLSETAKLLPEVKDKYTVLMLHAAVNRLLVNDLGGVRRETMEQFCTKIDYVALGHIHNRYELDQWIFNPGSLECVHLDEYNPGCEKGFYHIRVNGGQTDASYVPSHFRPVALYSVDLSTSQTPEEAYDLIYQKIERERPLPGALIQIVLRGYTPYSPHNLDLQRLTDTVKEEYGGCYAEIINRTNLPGNEQIRAESFVRREDIEKLVFSRLLDSQRSWSPDKLDGAVQVVQKIMDMALKGEKDSEIVDLLLSQGEVLL